MLVAACMEKHTGSPQTIKQHLAAINMLFDYLVISQREPDSPLFPAAIGKTGKLSRRPLVRTDAADMLKRRLKKAELPGDSHRHQSGSTTASCRSQSPRTQMRVLTTSARKPPLRTDKFAALWRIAAPVHPIRRSNCAESGYCELIAALKVRTSNKKGRHLSTGETIQLIEEFGVETPDGLIKG